MDVENIGIPAWLSPRSQPRIQFLPLSYLSLLLSSISVYNPLKGPAASKRNIIDALSLFLAGWVDAHPKRKHLLLHPFLSTSVRLFPKSIKR